MAVLSLLYVCLIFLVGEGKKFLDSIRGDLIEVVLCVILKIVVVLSQLVHDIISKILSSVTDI
jgi:hypothetical protein